MCIVLLINPPHTMKINCLLFACLLQGFFLRAQIGARYIDFSNRLEISLEKATSKTPLSQSLHAVRVIDARDDTAAIGFYSVTRAEAQKYGLRAGTALKDKNADAWSKIYHYAPSLEEGLGNWIGGYLQCRTGDPGKDNLLVVVKKFWLSYQAEKAGHDESGVSPAADGWDAGLLCKLDFYLEHDDGFYPLYRSDSLYTFKDPLYDYAGLHFVDNSAFFLETALKNSLEKLFTTDFGKVTEKRKKYSLAEIREESLQKPLFPVLHAGVLNKGVYTNYEEFKNNAPSIAAYEFREGSMGDILYVKDNGSEYPTRTAWGYCDGINIYINSGDKYSTLVRRGNAFYFYGIKGIARRSKLRFESWSGINFATNSGHKKSVYKINPRYLWLDLESGEVY